MSVCAQCVAVEQVGTRTETPTTFCAHVGSEERSEVTCVRVHVCTVSLRAKALHAHSQGSHLSSHIPLWPTDCCERRMPSWQASARLRGRSKHELTLPCGQRRCTTERPQLPVPSPPSSLCETPGGGGSARRPVGGGVDCTAPCISHMHTRSAGKRNSSPLRWCVDSNLGPSVTACTDATKGGRWAEGQW
jgi:hypothetical protein